MAAIDPNKTVDIWNQYGLPGLIIFALLIGIAYGAKYVFAFATSIHESLMKELSNVRQDMIKMRDEHRGDMSEMRSAHALERKEWGNRITQIIAENNKVITDLVSKISL